MRAINNITRGVCQVGINVWKIPSMPKALRDKFLFLWTGDYSGNNLKDSLGSSAVVSVLNKDWTTRHIPQTTSATFSVPNNSTFLNADGTDDFWFNSSDVRQQKTHADLIASTTMRTFVKYADFEPYHVYAIGILKAGEVITDAEKITLNRFFKLWAEYWGVFMDSGYMKDNRGGGSYWASQWYGFELDEANSSPDLVRIGSDMTEHNGEYLHAVLPVHSQIKACLLLHDGTVNYYLDPTDWSKKEDGTASDLTGADGNVMVEFPTYYRKVDNPSPGVYQHKISLSPLPGYQKVDKFYIGAYKATVNRTGVQKLWSVVNNTPEFRGGNNNASLDNQDNTLLGKPASYLTLPECRLRARNIVPGEYKWNLLPYRHSMLLYELFIIEYATLNSQKAVNTVLTSEGYRQGGLGDGVTTIYGSRWNDFNGYNPLIPCGVSNILASDSGEIDYAIPGFGHASGAVKVNRFRGIENPFGDIFELCDGASVFNEGEGGVSKFYICDNPENFADGTETNYDYRGNLPTSSAYITKMHHDEKGVFIPKAGGGGNTLIYWCDMLYTSGLVNAWRIVFRGGAGQYGAAVGFNSLMLQRDVYYRSTNYGTRLCYLP